MYQVNILKYFRKDGRLPTMHSLYWVNRYKQLISNDNVNPDPLSLSFTN